MSTLSILPNHYDVAYILDKMRDAGVTNHFGYGPEADGIHLRYRAEDFDAVQGILDAYPVDYANDVLRQARWDEVKALRQAKETAAAPTPFGMVQTDDASKIKILGMVQMALLAIQFGHPFEEEFTLEDNSVVMLSANDAITLGQATGGYVSQLFAHARTLRAQIEAAADINELAQIDVASGWPGEAE